MKPGRQQLLAEAWIGDAVLSLFARRKILGERGAISSEQFERMTSNQFLAAFGDPSSVEARIGRVYTEAGIDAAFAWIEANLVPLYQRQEEKRQRASGRRAPALPVASQAGE